MWKAEELNETRNEMALQETKFYVITYGDGYYQNGSMNGGYRCHVVIGGHKE